MAQSSSVALSRQHILSPFVSRGRLFYDHEVAENFLGGLPGIAKKMRWVRQHLPRNTRIKVGRSSAWHESDILQWLESKRTNPSANVP